MVERLIVRHVDGDFIKDEDEQLYIQSGSSDDKEQQLTNHVFIVFHCFKYSVSRSLICLINFGLYVRRYYVSIPYRF